MLGGKIMHLLSQMINNKHIYSNEDTWKGFPPVVVW